MKFLTPSYLLFCMCLLFGVNPVLALEDLTADTNIADTSIADTSKVSLDSNSNSNAKSDLSSSSDIVAKDSLLQNPTSDSTQVANKIDSLPVTDTLSNQAKTDTTLTVKKEKKKLVVKETSVNTIDEMKGNYRSPKKALFMSLIVPGLGQAYIGGTTSMVRAPLYFLADIGLGIGWYHFTVTKYHRAEKKYKRFADTHWDRKRYEDAVRLEFQTSTGVPNDTSVHREYCESIYPGSEQTLRPKCIEGSSDANYTTVIKGLDTALKYTADDISLERSGYYSPELFYENIGIYWQFLRGWDDTKALGYKKNGDTITTSGSSANRDRYQSLRRQANDYARMETWFLGGIFLNHIISAIDAGLTAHWHNKALYQTDVAWYDGLRMRPLLTILPKYSSLGVTAVLPF